MHWLGLRYFAATPDKCIINFFPEQFFFCLNKEKVKLALVAHEKSQNPSSRRRHFQQHANDMKALNYNKIVLSHKQQKIHLNLQTLVIALFVVVVCLRSMGISNDAMMTSRKRDSVLLLHTRIIDSHSQSR